MRVEIKKDSSGWILENLQNDDNSFSGQYTMIGINTSHTFMLPGITSLCVHFFKYATRLQFEVH